MAREETAQSPDAGRWSSRADRRCHSASRVGGGDAPGLQGRRHEPVRPSRQRLRPRAGGGRQGRGRLAVADRLPGRDHVPAVRRRHPLRPRPRHEHRAASRAPARPTRSRRRVAARGPVSRRQGGPGVPQGSRRVSRRPGRVRRGGGQGRQARPAEPAAAGPEARARDRGPHPRLRPAAHEGPGRQGRLGAPEGRGHPRLRPLHRPAGRSPLRRRPQPDAHPDPGLGGEPRHDARRGVDRHGPDRGEPARPQPRARREPVQREDPDQPADRGRDPRLRHRPAAGRGRSSRRPRR